MTWKGHLIQLVSFSSVRYWFLATEIYLYIDGKFMGKSGGFRIPDVIECQLIHQNEAARLKIIIKPSWGLFQEKYQLFINECFIEEGVMRVFFNVKPEN